MPGTKTGLFTPVRSSPVPESEQPSPLSGGWLGVSDNGGWL